MNKDDDSELKVKQHNMIHADETVKHDTYK